MSNRINSNSTRILIYCPHYFELFQFISYSIILISKNWAKRPNIYNVNNSEAVNARTADNEILQHLKFP
jgi:hypothetical protein